MINVVGKLPMMEVVERVVTFFRTTEKVNLPVVQKEVVYTEPEKVPMMEVVHKTISFLKTSERDSAPVKRKLQAPELTAPEQQICRKIEFDLNAAYFLKEQTRQPLELLELGYTDEDSIPAGICSVVDHAKARQIIREYQDKFIREEKYLFISNHSPEGDQVAIIDHCADPYKIMELACGQNENSTLHTRDIVSKLKEWHARFGIRITGIGLDFCEAEILNTNIDFKELAEEVHQFCPLASKYECITTDQLEEKMKKENTIYLYWN
jgi:hypothetical protein